MTHEDPVSSNMQPLDLASSAEVPHGSSAMAGCLRKCDQVTNETVARRSSTVPTTTFLEVVLVGVNENEHWTAGCACCSSGSSDVEIGEYLASLLSMLTIELLVLSIAIPRISDRYLLGTKEVDSDVSMPGHQPW